MRRPTCWEASSSCLLTMAWMVAARVVWSVGRSALEARRCCFSSSVSASSIWRYHVAFETKWGRPKLCLRQRQTYSVGCRAALEAMGEEMVDGERDGEESNAECVPLQCVVCSHCVCPLRTLRSVNDAIDLRIAAHGAAQKGRCNIQERSRHIFHVDFISHHTTSHQVITSSHWGSCLVSEERRPFKRGSQPQGN